MRISMIAVAAALLLPLAAAPANACGAAKNATKAEAFTADYSAAKKKPARKPKEKVEYMRAAPMK